MPLQLSYLLKSITPVIKNPRDKLFVDVRSLENRLKQSIEGEVRFDDGARGLYALDASNYTQIPIGVVLPKSGEDVIKAVEICRELGAPILPRGGGTSLTGSTVNVAVVLDFSKYLNRVLEVNKEERWARVEPGVILDDLRDAADECGLTFGPDPSTHDRCVMGGMIGNNSCGTHAQMSGRVSENIVELKILTYDGLLMDVGRTGSEQWELISHEGGRKAEIYSRLKALGERYAALIRDRFPRIPRRVSGYNLDYLLPENGFDIGRALVGSEGTLVTVLEAKVKLVYSAPKRSLLVLGYPDIYSAGDSVPQILLSGPIAIEAIDHKLLEFIKAKGGKNSKKLGMLPKGQAFLMVEYEGETKAESDAKARRLISELVKQGFPKECLILSDKKEDEHTLWDIREGGLGATAFVPGKPDTWPGWEDAGVPPHRIGNYLREYRKLLDCYDLDCSVYGHFSQGCIHCRINFDLTSQAGVKRYRAFIEEASDLCSRFGGSYSGEHGDGQSRGELWPKMFGPELVKAMQEFKMIWDPDFKMNPGKLVGNPPYKLDENLRLGADYKVKSSETHFQFPEDGGFNHATLRCVGVGKCRRTSDGYMCPSFMVTREESHTTRGRAHLLFDMTQKNVIQDGWQSEDVKAALDLCLACKGCKGDCPVSVDVATLKAEFLSHYYEGRVRPMHAYALGWIRRWARIASQVPWLANIFTQVPVLRMLLKKLGGISLKRQLPPFAMQSFTAWFARRPVKSGGQPVLLWPDTFTNYFRPDIGKATVEVLEDAGFRVLLPKSPLCCGRPLYDYGFLDEAKQRLREILRVLETPIRCGIPLIGMEPSCLAVFRDELLNLFPNDDLAKQLKEQSFMLAEFLNKKTSYVPPAFPVKKKALIQGHCHQAAVIGIDDEKELLEKMGIEANLMDAGCCGQAGSFGFEADKYDISMKIAHHRMVPKIQSAEKGTLIVANGFSCQSQIKDTTGRKALHLAQVIQRGITAAKAKQYPRPVESNLRLSRLVIVAILGVVTGIFSHRTLNRGTRIKQRR